MGMKINYINILKTKIKYIRDVPEIKQTVEGNWIDLYTPFDVVLSKPFQYEKIPLGIAMELPKGYEAIIAPRSSTYERYNVIIPNSIGIIDEAYCGDNDEWKCPVLYIPSKLNQGITLIPKHSRICQFKIIKRMELVAFESVTNLNLPSRGGFGSTGI